MKNNKTTHYYFKQNKEEYMFLLRKQNANKYTYYSVNNNPYIPITLDKITLVFSN